MADDETPDRPDDRPDAASGSGAATWLRESGWGAWIAVGAVMAVALVLILVGGNDDDDRPARSTGGADATAAGDQGSDGSDGSAAATTKPKDDCPDFSLGANLLGVPGVASEPGVHVWHDVEGFHVNRVPGDGTPDVVTGTLTAEGPALQLVSPEGPAATASDGAISFELSGDVDEVLFKAPCSSPKVTFDLRSGDAPLEASVVTVGRGETPPSVPFTLERGA